MALAAAIGMDRSSALIDAVCEGRLLLVGMVFLLMPSQIAAFGLPLLALGGPILRSINAIGSIEATQARQGSKAREEAELHGDSQTTITASTSSAQLRYWVSYAMLWGAVRALAPVLAWVPFVSHLQLLAVLWLQLPIVRAATRLLAPLVPLLRASRRKGLSDDSFAVRQPRANALYAPGLSRRSGAASGATAATTPPSSGSASAPATSDAVTDASQREKVD